MAMQNLRDQLLKAGLVDKKQKQQVETQQRREKKQKGVDKQSEQEAERQRLFAERQAQEAEAQRQLEAERAADKARHELVHRVRNICDAKAVRVRKPGPRRFHFVKRSGRIGHLMLNDALYDQLLIGSLAIVERLGEGEETPDLEVTSGGPPKAHGSRRPLMELLKPDRRETPRFAAVETHVLLAPESAERVQEIDPNAVRFWARKSNPIGYIADTAG